MQLTSNHPSSGDRRAARTLGSEGDDFGVHFLCLGKFVQRERCDAEARISDYNNRMC